MTASVKENRKREILDAAKKVFIRKGFDQSTMEDIIAETSLSKGGFYYYYKSTADILRDIMSDGIAYRMSKMNKFIASHALLTVNRRSLAEMLVDKMLDEGELISVYVIYLQAIRNNDELKSMYDDLVKETLTAFRENVKGDKTEDFQCYFTNFFINFMNSVFLGCEILGARDNFIQNRSFFIDMLNLYLERYDKGEIK